MEDHEDSIPTLLLFCPLDPLQYKDGGSVDDKICEQYAGELSDLFVWNGRLTTLPAEAEPIAIFPRSSKSPKTFYCPVCEGVVQVTANNIFCRSCSWNATEAGVNSVSELLQRETDPHPHLSEQFQNLVQAACDDKGSKIDTNASFMKKATQEQDACLFAQVTFEHLVDQRMQRGMFFKKQKTAYRHLLLPRIEILKGSNTTGEAVLPGLTVEIHEKLVVALVHNVRDDRVSILICAAREEDGQALTLATDEAGEARIQIPEEQLSDGCRIGVTELDFWFRYQSGAFSDIQFGVRVFARYERFEPEAI